MSTDTPTLSDVKEPVLVPVLSARFALRATHLAIVAVFCGLLLLVNYMPLRNTDLWSHVIFGQWILAHQALPTVDPIQPLAEGMRVIDTAWLSQVALAAVEGRWGAEGLSNLFAAVVWLSYLFLARACWVESRSLGATSMATLVALLVGWSRISTIRPEVFSVLCFTLLLWLLTKPRNVVDAEASAGPRGALTWLAVPLLFVVWANLHGSFICGLAFLGCQTVGRAIEVFWSERSSVAALRDREMRRWLYLFELAAVATLVNPYGIDLWIEVAEFGRNPNLQTLTEWSPLVMLGVGGREFVASIVLLLIVWRHSRVRVSVGSALMLGLFAMLALVQVRMVGWYGIVLAYVLAPHLGDLLAQVYGRPANDGNLALSSGDDLPAGRSWKYSLACLVLVWLAFAFSGFSKPILGGQPRSEASLYNPSTPRSVTNYLREHPPEGLVFAPHSWGDWLVWAGPKGLQPFAATHVHLLPTKVWEDYQRLAFVEAGSDGALERYRVMMVIVDKETQPLLSKAMRKADAWALRYEDDQALVFTRAAKAKSTVEPKPNEPQKVAKD